MATHSSSLFDFILLQAAVNGHRTRGGHFRTGATFTAVNLLRRRLVKYEEAVPYGQQSCQGYMSPQGRRLKVGVYGWTPILRLPIQIANFSITAWKSQTERVGYPIGCISTSRQILLWPVSDRATAGAVWRPVCPARQLPCLIKRPSKKHLGLSHLAASGN